MYKRQVYNPATGEVILEIAEATAAQVDAAVEAADRAFDAWSQTTPKTRAECLLKLADAIAAQAEPLAQLESLNCGKPLPVSYTHLDVYKRQADARPPRRRRTARC